MRIALVASPFISVPPARYGGTELFIAQLAKGLKDKGLDVVVYTNGDSKLDVETRWLYEHGDWPIRGELYSNIKDLNHAAWAVQDASGDADIIHVNNVSGLALSRFSRARFVYTIHHAHADELSQFYSYYPDIQYVSISRFQQERETMPRIRTIHHGVDMSSYKMQSKKQDYLCFLGRIAPMKGTDIAIDVAKRSGICLKIAGEVQPVYKEYFDAKIKPQIDGKFIEYVGEADLAAKNELLGNASAMLFPIQWNEPFGLVMIEAMATGTPVLAFSGGAVDEVVREGVSGHICRTTDEMVEHAKRIADRFSAPVLRDYVRQHFSVERMVRDYMELYSEMMLNPTVAPPKHAANVFPELPDDAEENQAVA